MTLNRPLVSAIEIQPSRLREQFIIRESDKPHYPPDAIAELTTYEIVLFLNSSVASKDERRGITDTLEEVLDATEKHEPFRRYTPEHSYIYSTRTNHYVTVNWDEQPPRVVVNGTFTLDMLNALYEMGLFEETLQVAQVFKTAASVERRGPLMATAASYIWDVEDEGFSRDDMGKESSSSIGDLGRNRASQYANLLHDIPAAVARGMMTKDDVARAVTTAAALSLDGTLLSPHPTARYLLASTSGTDAGEYEDGGDRIQQLMAERVQQIMQDLIPGYLFVVPPEGIIEGQILGDRRVPVITWEMWQERLHKALEENVTNGAPEWWLGDVDSWERELERAIRHGEEQYLRASSTLADVQTWLDAIETATREQAKRERESAEQKALVPYAAIIPLHSDADPSFFGVTHNRADALDPYADLRREFQRADYRTRNPHLNEPPRRIPDALQALLDTEAQHDAPGAAQPLGKTPLMLE